MVARATAQHMSNNDSSSDFGANDWLIEEMYEQYKSDPSSVDAAWAAYFAKNSPAQAQQATPAAAPAPAAAPQ
ncbi:MAG: hypothetical protein WAV52_09585, partial [Luteococcus japonicus]